PVDLRVEARLVVAGEGVADQSTERRVRPAIAEHETIRLAIRQLDLHRGEVLVQRTVGGGRRGGEPEGGGGQRGRQHGHSEASSATGCGSASPFRKNVATSS